MIAFWIHHKRNSLYYKSAAAGKTASGVKGKSFFFPPEHLDNFDRKPHFPQPLKAA